uniref:Upstream binding transcription factor, RNA polymerase I-like 1 n=2 Tax=Nannospalax galili TaxID=1026970 RepID=A0A8C6R1R6_NANGA
MEDNVLANDFRGFRRTLADLNWNKVAFEHFSGEMCKQKWLQISHKLRKVRTLTELVLDAKEHVKHLSKSEKYKKHPDFPKRPLTAYLRFYKEQRAQYSQIYPELNNLQLTKVLSEKYKQLPQNIKERYIQDFQKEKQDFEEKLAQFKEDHPDLVGDSKKSVVLRSHQTKVLEKLQGNKKHVKSPPESKFPQKVPFKGKPKKPPMNGYHKFHQDSWSSKELNHLPPRERMVEISRRWQRVPQSVKERYKNQAEELQKQYWVSLDLWLKRLTPEEYAAYRETEATCSKRMNLATPGGPSPKIRRTDLRISAKGVQERPGKEQRLLSPGTDSSETTQVHYGVSQGSGKNMMKDGKEDEWSDASDCRLTGEDEGDEDSEDSESNSSLSGDSSDLDSI